MSHSFYDRRTQFFREWRVLWSLHGADVILGAVYVLASFYFFRRVGYSQVYNVITPCFLTCIVVAYLTYSIGSSQSRGNTLPYFSSLPRERSVVWRAHTSFVVLVVLGLEAMIALGVYLKLGGADITPVYRLHPETFIWPFLAMVCMSWCMHLRYTKK